MRTVKNNRSVVVGIFIFLGLAILVFTIFTLGGQKKTFVKSFTINAVFNDVNGLLQGGNVWFSGVKIGTVKHMSFYGNSRVLVAMSIEESLHSHIRKDAFAKIGSEGLIGNKIVVIYGGTLAAPPVAKNDFLKVESSASTEDMMATLQANNKNILEITTKFKSISSKIDSGNGVLSTLINDRTMANNLKTTVASLQAAAVKTNNALSQLENFSAQLNKPGHSIHDLANDTTMFHNIKGTVSKLQNAVNDVNAFSANLKTVSDKMIRNNNVIGVLTNDTATAGSLKTTFKNLESGSHKLDEDLEAVQHNFLLRGFFRKKAKGKIQ
ncbi:MAG: hypothetical protein JWN76_768 [Chitinophagaceae bacterium]|nr:hypothetical protein [Chitinophagaceae bacterium]